MTKKIIFRADGSSTTGLGHLYRLFSLVEIVKDNFEFVFITHENSAISVIPEEYITELIPTNISIEEEPEWLVANFSSKEYTIIADGYQFTEVYQQQIKNKGFSLLYIDDLANAHMYADVVVNHSPYIHENHYSKESYTKLALGTKYALLRPLFLKEAKENRVIKIVNSAFVCFGGADPFNLTQKAVEAICEISSFKTIHVVLGGAYNHKAIFDLEEKHENKIKIYRNLSEERLIKVMLQCNFAIAPASTILYELCCVKMLILSGFYVDNQELIYKGLIEKQAVYSGGNFKNYTILDFKNKVKSVLKEKDINFYISNQHRLFNGNSKTLLMGLINQLHVSVRRTEKNDVLQVYNWSNDELVRKNSYNSEPIKLEDHKIWFSNKVKDKNTLFLINLVNDKPAGIVRYEIGKEFSVVGVLVSKEFRGQGLAAKFLMESAKHYFEYYDSPIIAYIKKTNRASVKAFELARYTYLKDEIIKGIVSFAYILKKDDVIR